jgi:RNA polymerase sigma-70 factor (ECF subfamily)
LFGALVLGAASRKRVFVPQPSSQDRPHGAATEPIDDLADIALVVRIGRGDRDALAEVYRRYGANAHAPARAVCSTRADDVVHDIFLRLWQQPSRFDPERGSLRTYLMMEAHGRAVDLVRNDAARRSRDTSELAVAPRKAPDVEMTVLAALDAADLSDRLSALPNGEREAIAVAYYGGFTYKQVAERLGLAEGTVKSRIRAGLRRLRTQVSDSWEVAD